MSMYIRLKRKNQSVFMHVEPSDSFSSIKDRVAELFGQESGNVMLYADDKVKELVDLATVSDQDIKNDDIVYFVLMKGAGWEQIEVEDKASS